jgi:ferredoxin
MSLPHPAGARPSSVGRRTAGENMLVIHPDECIDCGVCEPECPVDAIKPDTEPGMGKWFTINAEYARVWPNITMKREPPPDAKDWESKPDKANLLSPNLAQVIEAGMPAEFPSFMPHRVMIIDNATNAAVHVQKSIRSGNWFANSVMSIGRLDHWPPVPTQNCELSGKLGDFPV